MSTNSILDPATSKAGAAEMIDLCVPLLREVTTRAAEVFHLCEIESAEGEPNVNLPPLMLLLHAIEMTDGLAELLAESSVNPAILLLRSEFEAVISLDFMLAAETRKRSLAWLCCRLMEEREELDQMDINTEQGAAFWGIDDLGIPRPSAEHLAQIEKRRRNIDSTLRLEQFVHTKAAHDKHQGKRRKKGRYSPVPWYALCAVEGGLGGLAARVGMKGYHEFLYRRWSAIGHAADFHRHFVPNGSGEPRSYYKLRNPQQMSIVTTISTALLLRALRGMLLHYRPGSEYGLRQWYVDRVQAKFNVVAQQRFEPREIA